MTPGRRCRSPESSAGTCSPTTIHCSILAAAFMVSYYSVTYWYATFLQGRGLNTLPFIIALNAGGIVGSAFWGGVSEGRLGRRGAVTIAAALGIVVSPLYLMMQAGRSSSRARCWLVLALTGCGGLSRPISPSAFPLRFEAPAPGSAITRGRWQVPLRHSRSATWSMPGGSWARHDHINCVVRPCRVVAHLAWSRDTRRRKFSA